MNHQTRRGARTVWAALLVCWLGCSEPEPATQVVVTIDGAPSVMEQLKLVNAVLYAADTTDESEAGESHVFKLATRKTALAGEVKTPFSFTLRKGRSARFKLVVTGYSSDEADAPFLVEQKLISAFEPDQTLGLRVYLADACYDLPSPCVSLETTCVAAARACGAVTPVSAQAVNPGHELEPLAGAVPSDEGVCTFANACTRDYPCVPLADDAYVCRGLFAEWPMPERGSRTPFAYDYRTDSDVVADEVTRLFWQREPPKLYDGCSGIRQTAGDTCSWHEAAIYCSALTLAGRTWRLPTKIELESLIDPSTEQPAIDPKAFPATMSQEYWTASPVLASLPEGDDHPDAMFTVNFGHGEGSLSAVTETGAVRCVSGGEGRGGPPGTRYELDTRTETAHDVRTGLVWQTGHAGPIATWEEATTHCAQLGGGFRLPTMKELVTIVDPLGLYDSLAAPFSVPPPPLLPYFWSASASAARGPFTVDAAGYVSFEVGVRVAAEQNPENAIAFYVRCVR